MSYTRCNYMGCGESNKRSAFRFYTFPVNKEKQCDKWIEATGNSKLLEIDRFQLKRMCICEQHFEESDFINETHHRLNPSAVPKLFKRSNQLEPNAEHKGDCLQVEWNSKQWGTLIEKLEEYPILWDPSQEHVRNRNNVSSTYEAIADDLGCDVAILKKKVENLFQSYQNCKRRIKHNHAYKPTWSFYQPMDSFLRGIDVSTIIYDLRTDDPLGDCGNLEVNGNDTELSDMILDSQEIKMELPTLSQHNSSVYNTVEINIKKETPFLSPATQNNANKHTTLEKSAGKDDCSIYGELIAERLRKLTVKQRQLAINRIDDVFYEQFPLTMLHIPPKNTY